MQLNAECVRDIMLYLEENLHFTDKHDYGQYKSIKNTILAKCVHDKYGYSMDDINYSLDKLIEAQYINIDTTLRGTGNRLISFHVCSITIEGHSFIEVVRPEPIWDKIKRKTQSVASFTVDSIKKAATFAVTLYMTNPEEFQKIYGNIVQTFNI